MARCFGDGFDMYSTASDLVLGRWNTFNLSNNNLTLISGAQTQFDIGQALSLSWIGASLGGVFETRTNENTFYFSIRFRKRGVSGAATDGTYLGFVDGTDTQCSILWAADNSLQVFSGDPSGTQLYNLPTAFTINTWDSYQGLIVIDTDHGYVEIRKNNDVTPLFVLNNVNTQGGSGNNYVNGLRLTGFNLWWEYSQHDYDDVWVNSDNGASPTGWPGDVRAITLTADTAVQSEFFQNPNPVTATRGTATNSSSSATANIVRAVAVTPGASGEVASLLINITTGVTGHARMGLYDASGVNDGPGALLLTSDEVTNPVAGLNYFTVPPGTDVARNGTYWVALLSDVTLNVIGNIQTSVAAVSQSYGSGLPVTMNGFTTSSSFGYDWMGMTITPTNAGLVDDVTEDGDTTYVYSDTVGREDIYTVSSLGFNPLTIHGVTPFVFWRRSDSGLRAGTISVAANSSADTPVIVDVIPSITYVYAQTFMIVDPTGAPWTATTINGMQIGVKVAS